MRGRIGMAGREVHILDAYDGKRGNGRTLCRIFEGRIRLTEDDVSCRKCQDRFDHMQWIASGGKP